ncbi:hypothetical protein LCGC14_2342060 [marine sediment metagenome]|uniref:Uncharacterized protein n=1 Tax=marine sediment metagenome TaxID=412755 RepID=A0A0F9CBP0_9ZZZZ
MEIVRDTQGRLSSVHFGGEGRNLWIGKTGLGASGPSCGYNAHWYDLRHPWERYSIGEFRFVFFWKQLWRGLREVILAPEFLDD